MGRIYETAITIRAALAAGFAPTMGGAARSLAAVGAQAEGLKAVGRQAAQLEKVSAAAVGFSRLRLAATLAEDAYKDAAAAEQRFATEIAPLGVRTREQARDLERLSRQTGKAEAAMHRAWAEAAKSGEALRREGVDVSNLSRAHEQLSTAIEATERRQKALAQTLEVQKKYAGTLRALFGAPKDEPAWDAVKDRWRKLRGAVSSVGGEIRSLIGDAERLTFAGVGAVGGLYALVRKTSEHGAAVDDASQRLGIGVERLQELQYAAKLAGASTEDLDHGLGKLAVNIGKAASAKKRGGASFGIPGDIGEIQMLDAGGGGKPAPVEDPFQKIGLNAKKLAQLKPDEQLAEVADAIAKLATPAERAAAANALLGREVGLKMLPALARGRQGLAEMAEEARSAGAVLDRSTIASAAQFDDWSDRATFAIKGVGYSLGAALLPVATDALKEITIWVRANREQIKQWAQSAATWIETKAIPAIRHVGPQVWEIVQRVGALVDGAARLAGGFDNLAVAVVAFRAIPLAKSLVEMGVMLGSAALKSVEFARGLREAAAAKKALDAAGSLGGGGGVPGAPGGGGKSSVLDKVGAVVAGAGLGIGIGQFLNETFFDEQTNKQAGAFARRDFVEAQVRSDPSTWARTRAAAQAYEQRRRAEMLQAQMPSLLASAVSLPTVRPAPAATRIEVNYSPQTTITGATRDEIAREMDARHEQAKAEVLRHLEERAADARRVEYR